MNLAVEVDIEVINHMIRGWTLNRWCAMVKPVNMAWFAIDLNNSGIIYTIKRACRREVIVDGNNVKCTKKLGRRFNKLQCPMTIAL